MKLSTLTRKNFTIDVYKQVNVGTADAPIIDFQLDKTIPVLIGSNPFNGSQLFIYTDAPLIPASQVRNIKDRNGVTLDQSGRTTYYSVLYSEPMISLLGVVEGYKVTLK